MKRNMKILMAIVVLMLILGIMISPVFPFIYGLVLLLIIVYAVDPFGGNIYRRRAMRGRIRLSQGYYSQPDQSELKSHDLLDYGTIVLLALMGFGQIAYGCLLIALGLY